MKVKETELTCLADNSKGTDFTSDIIFVHGLGGDGITTWQSKTSSNYHFPELMQSDIAHARVWYLDYPAHKTKWTERGSSMGLYDRARNVMDLLISERIGDIPIIFICHSLGGLLVKKIIRLSSGSSNDELKKISINTKGIVFIATPHRGSNLANIAEYLNNLFLNLPGRSELVEELQGKSPELLELDEFYRENSEKLGIKTAAYRENKKLKGLFFVVDKISSDPYITSCATVPIDEDHEMICKPVKGKSSHIYKSIKRFVETVLKLNGQPPPSEHDTGCITDENSLEMKKNLSSENLTAHAHAPRQASKFHTSVEYALARLGAPPFIFSRDNLLYEGLRYVRGNIHPVLLIYGLPGSGKTTLLCEIAHSLAGNFKYFFALKFSGPETMEPAYFIEEINNFLSHLGRGLEIKRFQTLDLPLSIELLVAQMEGLPMVLLLDEVDNVSGGILDILIRAVKAVPGLRIILTSHSRIVESSMAHTLNVSPLSYGESLDFIDRYLEFFKIKGNAKELMMKLPASVTSHPHTLTILLSNLEDLPLELLLMEELPENILVYRKIVKTILSSIEKQKLDFLAFLSILRGLNFVNSLKILEITPPGGIITSINLLVSKSLIHRSGDIYHVPPIVSEILLESYPSVLENPVSQITVVLETKIQNFIANNIKNFPEELIPIAGEILHKFHLMGLYWQITRLVRVDFLENLNIRGFWKEYWLLLRLAYDAAKKLNNKENLLNIGFRIARKSIQMRDIDDGVKVLSELENVLGAEEKTKNHAEFLSHSAIFLEMEGKIDEALERLEKSKEIRQTLGDIEGNSIVEKLKGGIYLRRNRTDEARRSFEAAFSVLKDKFPGNKQLIEIETGIALCDFYEGNDSNALSRLRSALENCHKFSYRGELPRIYYYLSMVLDRQGNLEEALDYARKAKESAINMSPHIVNGSNLLINKIIHSINSKDISEGE